MKNGFIQIYTGEGKGKTTAALGLSFRAAGRGKKVLFVQFLKGIMTGEQISMSENKNIEHLKIAEIVRFFTTLSVEEQVELKATTQTEWNYLKTRIETDSIDLLVLDEIMAAIQHGLVEEKSVIDFLKNKPLEMEVILTGRSASDYLIAEADLVTEMKKIKHYYDQGVAARIGIEY
jgi:cob(I)alamin adenosyltransferase